MNEKIYTVYHGCDESFVHVLEYAKQDFFFPQNPNLLVAAFSTDERHAVVMSGKILSRNREYVTKWVMPLDLLTSIEKTPNGSEWFAPNVNMTIKHLTELPVEYILDYIEHNRRKYPNYTALNTAFSAKEIIFTRTPNQYYQGAEEVDKILERFKKSNGQ